MDSEGFTPLTDLDVGATIRGFVSGQKILKRYTLRKILGRGGMGIVWLAFDEELEREIAIKFLPEIVRHDRGALDNLKRETRRSLELTHPNIVRIYDFVQDEFCAGIAMEFIDGDTLSNLRAERPNKVFEAADLQQWVVQLCGALQYAHEAARVAHRDLKPSNLMINRRGQLKVADFGISRSLSDTITRATMVVQGASGTLVYMSPQQALGEPASAADDVYSLGATLYELMTTRPPFFTGDILAQVREKTAPTMTVRRQQLNIRGEVIPPVWEETIAACLAKDPAQRPKSALEILRRLSLSDTQTILAAPPLPFTLADPEAEKPAAATKPGTTKSDVKEESTPVIPANVPPKTVVMPAPANPPHAGMPLLPLPPLSHEMPETEENEPIGFNLSRSTKWWLAAGVVLLVLILALKNQFHPGADEAVVELASVPVGASVKVNGEFLGRTPVAKTQIKSGPATIEFEMVGHAPVTVQTNLVANKLTHLNVHLEAVVGMGVLTFITSPDDAAVTIDGREVTGRRVEVRAGKHSIRVSKEGYEPREIRNFDVRENQENKLEGIWLERSVGSLRVSILPPGANYEIRLDTGVKSAAANKVLTGIPVGEYQVRVFKEGYQLQVVPVSIKANQTNLIGPITLARNAGSLWINTVPSGASIELKNPEYGSQIFPEGSPVQDLPTGDYHVTVRLNGYTTTNFSITVTSNQTVRMANLPLTQGFGSLVLTADGAGAHFAIKGAKNETGSLPAHLYRLPAGSYSLEATLDRYEPVSQPLEVIANEEVTLKVPFERSKGSLQIVSLPTRATYVLTGEEISPRSGRTPEAVNDLPTGRYSLVATYNHASVTNEVVVERKQTVTSVIKLPFGTVKLESVPAKAVVFSGNVKVGETPLELPGVKPGKSEYRLELPGYRFTNVTALVQPQETTPVNINLTPYAGPQNGAKVWVNSLGMRFVPVGKFWICIWETRVKDFEQFYEQSHYNAGVGWREPGFKQTPTHPVINVSWNDAAAFCKWLTEEERKKGLLGEQEYRLPTDLEWSQAADLTGETGLTPAQRDGALPHVFLWGTAWPPPSGVGNFANVISYDEFEWTAPVGSFRPNKYGIFDLAGNAWEWCQDTYDSSTTNRVLRGESWNLWPNSNLSASNRRFLPPDTRISDVGFRLIIQPEAVR